MIYHNKALVLYVGVIGLCAGIALGLLFGVNLFGALFVLVAAGAFLVSAARGGGKRALFALCAMALAAVSLGLLRVAWTLQSEARDTLLSFQGQTVRAVGVVADDPDQRDTSLHLTLNIKTVNGAPARGELLALVPRDAQVEYGDTVEVRGRIEAPQAFETAGGRVFDYPGYLRVRGVSAVMQKAVLASSAPGGVSLRGALFSLKHFFENGLARVFPEPQNALLQGILLGERRGLPQDLTNAFISASLIHVVVLSGYNISIVSEAILRSLAFLPAIFRYSLGGAGMVLFALLTGGGATTLRALIMGLVGVSARYFHRPVVAMRALAVACAALVLWNPLALLYDTSFILSFVATFGLVALAPAVEARLTRLRVFRAGKWSGARSIAASTIAVQSFVLPALLYFTGTLSFTALPANLLALPLVPLTMGWGFAAGVLALLHPALALPPAIVATALLNWMLGVVRTAAAVPLGSVIVPAFPAWVAVLAYLPLGVWAARAYEKTPLTTRMSIR